jgi:hypothetical protein
VILEIDTHFFISPFSPSCIKRGKGDFSPSPFVKGGLRGILSSASMPGLLERTKRTISQIVIISIIAAQLGRM